MEKIYKGITFIRNERAKDKYSFTAYSKPTGLNLSCADIPAGGGTVTVATGGTISQTITYTSKATDTINPTVTITEDLCAEYKVEYNRAVEQYREEKLNDDGMER